MKGEGTARPLFLLLRTAKKRGRSHPRPWFCGFMNWPCSGTNARSRNELDAALAAGPEPSRNRQNLPLDTLVPLWHHPVMMSETENEFSLSRAPSIRRRRGKEQIPISWSFDIRTSDFP